MKRLLIIFAVMLSALAAWATPPHLACEAIFNRKDLRVKGNDIVNIIGDGNYFRSITSENNPKLMAEIKALVEKDKKRAYNKVDRYIDGEETIILNISSNGHIINVGLTTAEPGYVRLFIQSDPKAFE